LNSVLEIQGPWKCDLDTRWP